MESESLSHIHVISTVDRISGKTYLNSCTFFSFLLNSSDTAGIDKAFQFIFSKENRHPFSLTLKIDQQSDIRDAPSWFDKFCLILCHPGYLKYDNHILLGIISDQAIEENGFFNTMRHELKKQGFGPVAFIEIHKDRQSYSKEIAYAFYEENLDENEFYKWYINKATARDSLLNIFTNSTEEAFIDRILFLKQKTELHLATKEPILFNLIIRLHKKTGEAYQYQQLSEALGEDLSSNKMYLDYLLSNFKEGDDEDGIELSKLMQIKKFYHQQYEVLPLWYKRFGHIIKVLTGRRTLKSLFYNKQKKKK